MAKYRVIQSFSDLNDNEHIYRPGDEFPREGYDASVDRLISLSSCSNKIGKPLIELIKDDAPDEEPGSDAIEEQSKPKRRRSKKQ